MDGFFWRVGGGGGMLFFLDMPDIFLLVNSRCWDRAHLASKKKLRLHPSPFPTIMHIWVPYGLWGVQLGSAWVTYGLSHIGFGQMGPILVPHNSPIKKTEMISTYLFKLISLFIMHC